MSLLTQSLVAEEPAAQPLTGPQQLSSSPNSYGRLDEFFFSGESPLFDGWSFGWDRGPTYRLDRVIPIPLITHDLAAPILPDIKISGRIGGSFMVDSGHLDELADDSNHAQVKLRRGRVFTSGTYDGFYRYYYRVQFAVEGSRVFFNDFYIRHPFQDGRHALQLGYMDPPVGLQALASIGDYGLMELPAPVSALAPGMRFGLQYDGASVPAKLAWAVNLSSVGQNQQIEGEGSASAPVRGSARLVFLPVHLSSPRIDRIVHVGASYSYLVAGDDTLRIRARPESFLGKFAVDTGELVYDRAQTFGFELLNKYGSFTHQTEFLGTWVDKSAGDTAFLYGWYYECAYALFGDHRSYDARRGILRGVESSEDRDRPYIGVIEISARYSFLNLNNGVEEGGLQRIGSLGATWWITSWLALRGEYLLARVKTPMADSTDSIVQGRLQLQF